MCKCLYFSLFVVTLFQLRSGNSARKRTQVCPRFSRFTLFSLIGKGKKKLDQMWETWKKKIKRQEIWRGKKSAWQLCGNWKMQMTWSWFQLSDAPMLELITAVGRRKRDEDSANEILKTLERNSIPDTKVLEGQVERWRMWEFPGEGSWQEFLPPGLMSLGWQGLTSGGHPTSCSRKMWPQGQRWESERPWLDPQRGKRIVLEPQRQSSSGCISNALSIQKGLQ